METLLRKQNELYKELVQILLPHYDEETNGDRTTHSIKQLQFSISEINKQIAKAKQQCNCANGEILVEYSGGTPRCKWCGKDLHIIEDRSHLITINDGLDDDKEEQQTKPELYRKVFIRTEDDLPKEDGEYFVFVKGSVGMDVYEYYRGASDHEYWLETFDWYLQPIPEAPGGINIPSLYSLLQ